MSPIAHALLKHKVSLAKPKAGCRLGNDMGVQVPITASTKTGRSKTAFSSRGFHWSLGAVGVSVVCLAGKANGEMGVLDCIR